MEEGEVLEPEEVRRLIPIAIDLIRDDLNPPGFKRGVMEKLSFEEASWKLVAVQTYVGRRLARTIANAWSTEHDTWVCTAGDVLDQIEQEMLEQWADDDPSHPAE